MILIISLIAPAIDSYFGITFEIISMNMKLVQIRTNKKLLKNVTKTHTSVTKKSNAHKNELKKCANDEKKNRRDQKKCVSIDIH